MKPDDAPRSSPTYRVVDPNHDPDLPLVKLLNLIISEGILSGASQIQVASGPEQCRVRFQKGRSWLDVMTIPALVARPLVNRIRAMAGLDRLGGPTTTGGQLRVAGSGTEVSVKATVRDQGEGLEEVLLELSDR